MLTYNPRLGKPLAEHSRLPTRRDSTPCRESVLQVKRARSEVDDPMMGPKNLGPEQSRHGLGTSKQIAMNETFQIDHADVFAHDIHRADGEPADACDLHAALLQVNRRRTKLRLMKRNVQPPNKSAVEQRRKRACVHHQARGFTVDGCIYVKVIRVANANRHAPKAAILCPRRFAWKSRIHF